MKSRHFLFLSVFSFTTLLWSQPQQRQPALVQLQSDSLATGRYTRGFLSCSDSALITGSNYFSFVDVFDALPFTTTLRRNAAGQPAPAWMFAGLPGVYRLDYNGLVLDDPVTGKVDLRMIPAESISHCQLLLDPQKRRLAAFGIGQTMQLVSRDLASLPIRSRVTYRTGQNGYDDIDARLGMLPRSNVAINAGGIAKSYVGTRAHEKYSVQKIDAAVKAIFKKRWSLRYRLLKYKSDLDVVLPVLPQPSDVVLPLLPQLQQPHEKIDRYDHGFFLHRDSTLSAFVQLTDLHKEYYGNHHQHIDQIYDLFQIRSGLEYRRSFRALHARFGVDGINRFTKSHIRSSLYRWQLDGWADFTFPFSPRLQSVFTLLLRKMRAEEAQMLPKWSLTYRCRPQTQLVLWMNRDWQFPSYESRYSDGPLVLGNPDLQPLEYTHLGMVARFANHRFTLMAGTSALFLDNSHTTAWRVDQPVYINNRDKERYFIDLFCTYDLGRFRLLLEARHGFFPGLDSGHYMTDLPAQSGQAYLRFFDIFFKGDLHADLRIGCAFWGERYSALPYGVQQGKTYYRLDPVVVPYAHAKCIIKDATLFLSVDNPLSLDYQIMYGFAMPKQLIRWGFSWNFLD